MAASKDVGRNASLWDQEQPIAGTFHKLPASQDATQRRFLYTSRLLPSLLRGEAKQSKRWTCFFGLHLKGTKRKPTIWWFHVIHIMFIDFIKCGTIGFNKTNNSIHFSMVQTKIHLQSYYIWKERIYLPTCYEVKIVLHYFQIGLVYIVLVGYVYDFVVFSYLMTLYRCFGVYNYYN